MAPVPIFSFVLLVIEPLLLPLLSLHFFFFPRMGRDERRKKKFGSDRTIVEEGESFEEEGLERGDERSARTWQESVYP